VLTAELQGTAEWHLERAGRLTASLFGAALGLSPYLSRQELWRQLTGRSESFTGNPATDWGSEHEPDARHAFETETGIFVSPAGFVPFEDWSGCSPDGYIEGNGLVEFKCPFTQRLYEDVPDYYRAQVVGQLGITKRDFCWFCCWTPDGFKKWRIDAEPKTWDRMTDALKDFWRCVKEDKEPKRAKKFQLGA
jgi:putative phage-type endonuclease